MGGNWISFLLHPAVGVHAEDGSVKAASHAAQNEMSIRNAITTLSIQVDDFVLCSIFDLPKQ